jgi:hypothetical protein
MEHSSKLKISELYFLQRASFSLSPGCSSGPVYPNASHLVRVAHHFDSSGTARFTLRGRNPEFELRVIWSLESQFSQITSGQLI